MHTMPDSEFHRYKKIKQKGDVVPIQIAVILQTNICDNNFRQKV